jgi:hypothetical protein
MGPEIQLAGFFFSAEDWMEYDEDTRGLLLAAAADGGEDLFEDQPTRVVTRARARAGA